MSLKVKLFSSLKKTIYGLFILWVCGLTPLIYFEGYSSHFGAGQTFNVNFLGQSDRSQKLAQIRSEISEQSQTLPKLSPQSNQIAPQQTVAAYFFLSIFNSSFLLAAIDSPASVTLFCLGKVPELVLVENSVGVPLPEKPPPFS
jgi:hypothetical protein